MEVIEGQVALAAQGNLRAPWLSKAEFRSAAYTTNWHELWAVL